MDKPAINMDFSLMKTRPVIRSEQFRTPLRLERRIGLWVDRIGSAVDTKLRKPLRILGLYGAVHVMSGAGTFRSERTGRIPISAGDTMLLFPDEPATYAARKKWQTVWIVWDGEEASRLEECGYLDPCRPVVRDVHGAVEEAYRALLPMMAAEDMSSVLRRKNVVLEMIARLHLAGLPKPSATDKRIKAAITHLTDHCTEPLNIPVVAARFGLSSSHFRHLFQAHTGCGPREFITGLRIARAKKLLARGLPIKQVASQTGYRDIFYFMRVFRRVTGVTAGTFLG